MRLLILSLLTLLTVPFTSYAERLDGPTQADREAQRRAIEARKKELDLWMTGLTSDVQMIFGEAQTCPILTLPMKEAFWARDEQQKGQELILFEAGILATVLSNRLGPCPWDVRLHLKLTPCYVGWWEDGELVEEDLRWPDLYINVCVPWKVNGYYKPERWITDGILSGVR